MGLFKLSSYFNHLLRARTWHGVHSPFVFTFVESCLRRSRTTEEDIESYFQSLGFKVYVGSSADFADIRDQRGEKKAFIISDIYRDRDSFLQWNRLCADPAVSVSVDLFRAGILVTGLNQHKQHFRLRY